MAGRELRLGVRQWSEVLEAVGCETVRFTMSDLHLMLCSASPQDIFIITV